MQCFNKTEVSLLRQKEDNTRADLIHAKRQVDAQQMALQYSEGEKLGLQHLLADQEVATNTLQKQLDLVMQITCQCL